MRDKFLVLWIGLQIIWVVSCGHTYESIEDVKRLIKDMERDYERSIRPVKDMTSPIFVRVGFELISIPEINEREQTITVSGVLKMYWTDVQMIWDPSDYGGVTVFTINSDRVWTPMVVLANTNEQIETIGDPNLFVRYYFDGSAMYYPGAILKASCELDVTNYPLDHHHCALKFASWGFFPEEYVFVNLTSEVDKTVFTPNGLWTMLRSEILTYSIPNLTAIYEVTLHMERQPVYVIVNVITPALLLSFLNLLIFFIPTESGERMSFGITVLLAIAVFLTIVADHLPHTSTSMAYFSYYLLFVLIISTCVALSTICSLCLYHRDDHYPMCGCWKYLVRAMGCGYRSNTNGSSPPPSESRDAESVTMRLGDWRYNFYGRKLGSSVFHGGSHKNYMYDNACSDNQSLQITWPDVSVAFDRVSFCFYFLIFISVTVVSFTGIYLKSRDSVED